MLYKVVDSEYIIRGNCPLFACRCCHTKYGFEHQEWCEAYRLTCPTCRDCLYYNELQNECKHPVAKKERKEVLPYEKDQCPLRKRKNA